MNFGGRADAAASTDILGPRTVAQLTDSLDMLDVVLDESVLATLDELAPPGRVIVPQYGYDGMAWVPWGPHQNWWNQPKDATEVP